MKKKYSAIFAHEMRYVCWFLIAGMIISMLGVGYCWLYIHLATDITLDNYMYSQGSVIVCNIVEFLKVMQTGLFLGISILTVVQFYEQKVKTTSEFLGSLPLKRVYTLWIKYVSGILTITLPILVFMVGSVGIFQYYINDILKESLSNPYFDFIYANESIENLLLNIGMFWLSAIVLYSIYFLTQIIVNPCLIAGFVGMAAALAPAYLIRQFDLLFVSFRGYAEETHKLFEIFLPWFGNSLGNNLVPSFEGELTENYLYRGFNVVTFSDLFPKFLCLISIWLFSMILIAILYRRQNFTDGRFITSSVLEHLFVGCISVCAAMFLAVFSNEGRFSFLVSLIIMIIVAVLTGMIVRQAIRRYYS